MPKKELPLSEAPLHEKRQRSARARGTIAVIISLLFLGTLFHPVSRSYHPACHAYSRLRPQTVEERVHKVLAGTPLIGMSLGFQLSARAYVLQTGTMISRFSYGFSMVITYMGTSPRHSRRPAYPSMLTCRGCERARMAGLSGASTPRARRMARTGPTRTTRTVCL
jgi:hypothetical protein